MPRVTVFTPTYNRAHTLSRAYESLRQQTFCDFEWLIVDDGSTDGTEELVSSWDAPFVLRCIRQDHAGKHIAHNRAACAAAGEFFLTLDSDDEFMPEAMGRLVHLWDALPHDLHAKLCGIAGLSVNESGSIVGDPFPLSPMDVDLRTLHYVHRIYGEKCLMVRTDLARRHLFPEIRGTNFVPEGVVWHEMAKRYEVCCVNEPFRKYHAGADTLSKTSRFSNAPGRLYYYRWLLANDLPFALKCPAPFLKAAAMLPLLSLVHAFQRRTHA